MENRRSLIKVYTDKMKKHLDKMIENVVAGENCPCECLECVFEASNNIYGSGCGNVNNAKDFVFFNKNLSTKEIKEKLIKIKVELGATDEQKKRSPEEAEEMYRHDYNLAWTTFKEFLRPMQDFYENYNNNRTLAYNKERKVAYIVHIDTDAVIGTYYLDTIASIEELRDEYISDLNTVIECMASDWKVDEEKLIDVISWRRRIKEVYSENN